MNDTRLLTVFDTYAGLDILTSSTWDIFSRDVQENKLNQAGVTDSSVREEVINELKNRPSFLVHVAKSFFPFGHINFAEVGTAQGMQSGIFARHFFNSFVYTCDIQDVAHPSLHVTNNIEFIKGDSKVMCEKIQSDKRKIDFFWIDGSHDKNAVLQDVKNLLPVSHLDTIWAFDDFDVRFGCYAEIEMIALNSMEHVVVEIGRTASMNPNTIVIARGLKI